MGIQQILLGTGASKKLYVDDVFSTYLLTGNQTARSVNTGIDMTEGGLVWSKSRTETHSHFLYDTERGVNKYIRSDGSAAEYTESGSLTAFNNNGFSLGTWAGVNEQSEDHVNWSFRKAKGFFDIVTYTGNSTNRTISHNLGCKPGMILFKNLDAAENWRGYHRELGATKNIEINNDNAAGASTTPFNNTEPTATTFSVGTDGATNGNGQSIVAYLFAGGESSAATARSVSFNGVNDRLVIPTDDDLEMGTGAFTIEGWVKSDSQGVVRTIYDGAGSSSYVSRIALFIDDTDKFRVYVNNTSKDSDILIRKGQWYHFAFTRTGTTSRLFINGDLEKTWSDSINYSKPGTNGYIASTNATSHWFDGSVSNFRIVKGTALYTASFNPPTAPLTNVTNTKLLCCNNSSTTGSTVSPTTISDPTGSTASTDSPFYDPDGFKFGADGDKDIIKCGSFTGLGSTDVEVNLGWEPQWVLIKNSADNGTNWKLLDSGRGFHIADQDDRPINPNQTGAESSYATNVGHLTSAGFVITTSSGEYGGNNDKMIYVAIRNLDGYVGKPIETGTDAFNVVKGNSSGSIPNFASNFPVDMGIYREDSSAYSWHLHTKKVGNYAIKPDNSTAENTSSDSDATFDSNAGWGKFGYNTDKVSWMWRRHAGFDVVTAEGTGVARELRHSLNAVPEMIWCKNRSEQRNWVVGHKDLDGGTAPWTHYLSLNLTSAEGDDAGAWNDTAPTSTHFSVGTWNEVNENQKNMVYMLFASVTGVSKCGSYDGSDSDQTITVGFQPRFVIIKCITASDDWCVWDTTRGWASGNDSRLKLNTSEAASTTVDVGAPTSTGFTVGGGQNSWNNSGRKYIYYAHA